MNEFGPVGGGLRWRKSDQANIKFVVSSELYLVSVQIQQPLSSSFSLTGTDKWNIDWNMSFQYFNSCDKKKRFVFVKDLFA